MAKILGVDPGLTGGLAILDATLNRIEAAVDIPTDGTAAKRRVSVQAVIDFIERYNPAVCYLERAQAFPGQGASSGFTYGRAVGSLEAVVLACGVPLQLVEASMWKRHFQLPAKDKEAARQRALHLLPSSAPFLTLKKHHGLAEAALIALYGSQVYGSQVKR